MEFPDAHPVILGSVITRAGLRLLAKKTAADAVEIRADALLADGATADEIETALRKRKQPVLLTLRIPPRAASARGKSTSVARFTCASCRTSRPSTSNSRPPPRCNLSSTSPRHMGKTVVLSAHAIAKAAPEKQFAKWTAQFEPRPRTILKIAARIQSWHDLQHLAALLVNHRDWPIAVMGLGPYAAQSRSVLTALGSRLVYGYLDKPAAPGQPSTADVRKMVKSVRNLG